jgi:hypothetical protein
MIKISASDSDWPVLDEWLIGVWTVLPSTWPVFDQFWAMVQVDRPNISWSNVAGQAFTGSKRKLEHPRTDVAGQFIMAKHWESNIARQQFVVEPKLRSNLNGQTLVVNVHLHPLLRGGPLRLEPAPQEAHLVKAKLEKSCGKSC